MTKPQIIGICARSTNNVLGGKGRLLWNSPADLRHFQHLTLGNPCVIGAKTWINMPLLPGRLTIVFSTRNRDKRFAPAYEIRVHTQHSAIFIDQPVDVIALAQCFPKIFICGGAETYDSFAPYITKWVITEIPEHIPNGDTFFNPQWLRGFEISCMHSLPAPNLIVKEWRRIT